MSFFIKEGASELTDITVGVQVVVVVDVVGGICHRIACVDLVQQQSPGHLGADIPAPPLTA